MKIAQLLLAFTLSYKLSIYVHDKQLTYSLYYTVHVECIRSSKY